MCKYIAKQNLSLASADSMNKMCRDMFPDSKIAANMKCGRNKATAIVKEMSTMAMADLAERMKRLPWSIATDGSNEKDKKLFPLVVTMEGEDGLVTPQLLAIPNCDKNATGENIFDVVHKELAVQDVSWQNCVAFGSDNAPVMTGLHKGVIAFVRKKQTNIHLAGCCLHLVHIGAKKGAGCLAAVEDILIDIFYYFQRSVNRQTELKDLQDLYDVEQRKLIKHVCTRWLSIKRCLERLMDNWGPLLHFFRKEAKSLESGSKAADSKSSGSQTSKKVQKVYDFLRSPTNKLHCQFLKYTLKVYDKVLVGLQREDPKIHVLRANLVQLLQDLFDRFVVPSESGKDVKQVQFKLRNKQKTDTDLLIGSAAKEMIQDAQKHNLRQERITDFYKSVRLYFTTVCTYLLNNLPLDDKVLINAVVADPRQRKEATSSQLEFFLERFSMLKGEAEQDVILEQFAKYQRSPLEDEEDDRLDVTWTKLGKEFPELARVMKGILTVPHSSAPCERVFSMVTKTCTDQRSSLHQSTTEALLIVKTKPNKELDDKALKQLKSAYYLGLK
ncbi:hypothetical protein V1264_005823 [Littorina saxatilis]|uniref:HAT C-terminal dimerisation domain-containing protein n=1 Tax=Littorina saxatilis TaxID=31220 RepID=A0AAN9B0D9_9CAEN